MADVIFAAGSQCSMPINSGAFFQSCQLVNVRINMDPVTSTTNPTIKQLAFVNELMYSFVGTIFPRRNVLVTLSSSPVWQTVLKPDASPINRPIPTPIAYDDIPTAVFTFLFPDDGVADNNIVVSKDCCVTLVSNITSPHVGSLSTYVSALIDHYNAMVSAVAAVESSNVSWQNVVQAASNAKAVLMRVEGYPGLGPYETTVQDAVQTIDMSIQGVQNACVPGGSAECSQQQAAAILAMRTLLAHVQAEMTSAQQFLDAEVLRLQNRATSIASSLNTILDQVKSAMNPTHASHHARTPLFFPVRRDGLTLYPGYRADEIQRFLARLSVPAEPPSSELRDSYPRTQVRRVRRRPLDATFVPLETYGERVFTLTPPSGIYDDGAAHDLNLPDGYLYLPAHTVEPNIKFLSTSNTIIRPMATDQTGGNQAAGNLFERRDPSKWQSTLMGIQVRSGDDARLSPDYSYKMNFEWVFSAKGPHSYTPPGGANLSGIANIIAMGATILPGSWKRDYSKTFANPQHTLPDADQWSTQSTSGVFEFKRADLVSIHGTGYVGIEFDLLFFGGSYQFHCFRYEIEHYL